MADAPSSFVLKIVVPRTVRIERASLARDDFFEWLWERFGGDGGLQGVHEGTLLSEQAAQAGLETESWTLDAAEAPRERDWIGGQASAEAELYFESELQARQAMEKLRALDGVAVVGLREQKAEDWDAQWKASFLGNAKGVKVPPFWRILPPWVSAEEADLTTGEVVLRINPGAGFGTGTHETTQLCLEAIAEVAGSPQGLAGKQALDFGSGSGILSIGAALLGAEVKGVEIDLLAIDNAKENAELNRVEGRIAYSRTFQEIQGSSGTYPLVIANILKPVLLEFCVELVARLEKERGALILSGLVAKDVAEVAAAFSARIGCAPRERSLGEWRALVWRYGGQ